MDEIARRRSPSPRRQRVHLNNVLLLSTTFGIYYLSFVSSTTKTFAVVAFTTSCLKVNRQRWEKSDCRQQVPHATFVEEALFHHMRQRQSVLSSPVLIVSLRSLASMNQHDISNLDDEHQSIVNGDNVAGEFSTFVKNTTYVHGSSYETHQSNNFLRTVDDKRSSDDELDGTIHQPDEVIQEREGRVTLDFTLESSSLDYTRQPAKIDLLFNENNNFDDSLATKKRKKLQLVEDKPKMVPRLTGFNVVLTHCTADFDSLASAVGLAKLWSNEHGNDIPGPLKHNQQHSSNLIKSFDSYSHVPTFVVLPRGAHPGVQRFLALHKHLFPIRSLKSLPDDLTRLNRLALVDAQRRDRIGPAVTLLEHAKRVTVVDHHVDQDSDIVATDYVVDKVGSVSTIIVERLIDAGITLSDAEATLLALGIHGDTGSLRFDSTTVRDARALAWCLDSGASQTAIAEHAQSSLSLEQQGVLTQALVNTNTTVVYGVSVSTVLLSADGFIQGLAAVTQDALDLSSSDVYLLGLVYEAKSGGSRKRKKNLSKSEKDQQNAALLTSRVLAKIDDENGVVGANHEELRQSTNNLNHQTDSALTKIPIDYNANNGTYDLELTRPPTVIDSKADETFRRTRLRIAFDRIDISRTGFIEHHDVAYAMSSSGIVLSDPSTVSDLIEAVDADGDGKIDFDEFVEFATRAEIVQLEGNGNCNTRKACTMIIIGRVKAGMNMKGVKLNKLLEKFGGGGHPKAASATLRLNSESEAQGVLQDLVDELIETSLQSQPTAGDFMTAPVLSVKQNMNENQVVDIFTRYGVRALPVVDDDNNVIGLVSYQVVEAAKQRQWNKDQKRMRQLEEAVAKGVALPEPDEKLRTERRRGGGSAVKGWMLQHVQTVEASMTMAQVEAILLENDVGSLPVVADGTKKLVGMVTRTDILRQHRYYDSLPYHNKGFADSIAARKPIIELRKKLKQFDLD